VKVIDTGVDGINFFLIILSDYSCSSMAAYSTDTSRTQTKLAARGREVGIWTWMERLNM
jgi:hypothetical protein